MSEILEMIGENPVGSNMGSLVAMSEFGVEPLEKDVLGDLDVMNNLRATVGKMDTTSVSSGSGYGRTTPTYKQWEEVSITLFKNNVNFPKLVDQFFGNHVNDKKFYCSLTFIWNKLDDWNDVTDLRLNGFVSGFDYGDMIKDDVQKITFTFQPMGAPKVFNGFATP